MQHYSMEIDREDDQFSEIADKFGEKLTLESSSSTQLVEEVIHDEDDVVYVIDDDDEDEDGEEEEEGEFEFSFGGGEVHSPVSAEEAFHNGQIRPIFPFFGENLVNSDEVAEAAVGKSSYGPPVKKVFVVSSSSEDDNVAEGPYCVWSTEESPGENPETVAAPEMSRKSNSTGFSRLWRMKDLLVRSNSDGKDTFVFLTGKSTAAAMSKEAAEKKKKKVMSLSEIKVGGRNEAETTSSSAANEGGQTVEKKKKKKKKVTMTASTAAYEALYGKKEKKKGGGKSYLPYRQDLVGFFTNVNGMTRNVHPY